MKIFSAQLKGTTTVAEGANVSLTGSFSGSIAGIDINSTNTFTSSTSARLNSIETISASNLSRINSLETTSASVDNLNVIQNSRLDSLENKTGSLASTGSNTFIGTQTITGSVYISQNLIVQGSSSLQNITASAVDIGTNKIILNVNNPAIRYAGISVYDSGSTSGTGSLFWDSVNNYWLYEHPEDSGAPYNSAILISGPKNTGSLGEESGLVTNYVVKSIGSDHISSSAIYDDGAIISLKSNSEISGSLSISGSNLILNSSNAGNTGLISLKVGGTEIGQLYSLASGIALYAGTDNYLKLSSGDTERIRLTSDGKIGVGITNPSELFHIKGAANYLNIQQSSTDGGIKFSNENNTPLWTLTHDFINGHFKFNNYNVSTPTLILQHSTNNVGIGTTNPQYKLHIVGTALATDTLIAGHTGGNLRLSGDIDGGLFLSGNNMYLMDWSTATKGLTVNLSTGVSTFSHAVNAASFNAPNFGLSGTATNTIQGSGSQFIYFQGGGSSYTTLQQGIGVFKYWVFDGSSWVNSLQLKNNGYIGIGTSNPASKLDIDGGSIRMGEFLNSASSLIGKQRASTGNFYSSVEFYSTTSEDTIIFNTHLSGVSAGERMRITGGGNVGINTNSPGQQLHIYNTSNYVGMLLNGSNAPQYCVAQGVSTTAKWKMGISGNNGDSFAISSGTTNNDRVHINSSGYVGINNWSPGYVLDVGGPIKAGNSVFNLAYIPDQGTNNAYMHIKTNLYMGGAGNTMYIMGGFRFKGYQYNSNGWGEGTVAFHNWSGAFYNITVQNTGFAGFVKSPYVSSDGYAVFVVSNEFYTGVIVDYFQTVYTFRYPAVTAYTTSNSLTGAY